MVKRYLLPIGIITVIVGILLFTRGLLTSKPLSHQKSSTSSTWFKPPFKLESRSGPVIIIVIDALRIDFCLEPIDSKNAPIFSNKFKVLYEYAKKYPANAKLFQFIADPPTATTQRLAGITAGSLPSFVEAFANFSGDCFLADNIIYQMLNDPRYQRLHLLGDDTWLHLFPFITQKSTGIVKGYHSFHLFDLHSVDTGIKDHLFPILEEKNYDVIIAHFLGLDHCGHKFGPSHPQCADKLSELDGVIRKVIEEMPPNAELFIFGDHGMTDEGDHGGDSPKEVSSALFYYSKWPKTTREENFSLDGLSEEFKSRRFDEKKLSAFFDRDYRTDVLTGSVFQIDFAPSLSHLTGLPIPFGNLGSIIPDLFFGRQQGLLSSLKDLANGLYMNAHQASEYFQSLPSYLSDFSQFAEIIEKADLFLAEVELNGEDESRQLEYLQKSILLYYEYLQLSSKHCRSIWANYDYTKILAGILLLATGSICFTIWLLMTSGLLVSASLLFALGCITVTRYLAKFTNSFIIHEDSVATLTLSSIFIFQILVSEGSLRFLLLAAITRFLKVLFTCREEHGKACISFSHRNIEPFSFTGILILCVVLLSSTKAIGKYKYSWPAYFALLSYQLFCWARETFDLDDHGLQIVLPRLAMLLICFVLLSGIYLKDSKMIMDATRFAVALVQRPFGGWLLINITPIMEALYEHFSKDSFFFAVILFYHELLMFFWTGHQAEIGSVHWEAGFVGWSSLNQLRAATFICINLLAGPILATFISSQHHETLIILTMLSAWEIFFEAVSISLLLKHLMLWSVFTPRLLLQILFFSVKLFALTISLIVRRVPRN